MFRTVAVTAVALALAAGCSGSTPETSDGTSLPAPPTAVPPVAPPAEFWSQPADSPDRLAEVAQATRQLDVCALLPREVLAGIGEVEAVTVGVNSCTAVFTSGATVNWSTTLLPGFTANPRASDEHVDGVELRLVPDRDTGDARSCGATLRFPSTAALYMGVTPESGTDPCDVARGLTPGILDRWRAGPGRSADTPDTVVRGADPCAVRDQLDGATPSDDIVRLETCKFDYRGEEVTVTYDYRIPASLTERSTTQDLDGHAVHRTVSVYDNSIPIYLAAVGPELPAGSTAYGPRVPAIEVSSKTDEVAREVTGRVIGLFG